MKFPTSSPPFFLSRFFGYRVFQNSPLKTCPTPFVLESASTLFIPCPLLSRLFLFPSFLSSSASWHSSVRDLKSRLCKTAVRYRVACQNAVQASILQMASQENVSASSQPGRNISLFFFLSHLFLIASASPFRSLICLWSTVRFPFFSSPETWLRVDFRVPPFDCYCLISRAVSTHCTL